MTEGENLNIMLIRTIEYDMSGVSNPSHAFGRFLLFQYASEIHLHTKKSKFNAVYLVSLVAK